MTGRIEKTVFISYRRTNFYIALAVYQDLTQHGYDVFFDYLSIDSGDFEQLIIENIKARAHFIVILTPSALKHCNRPGDWLRREIETALDERRNIVPLFLDGFSFGSPSIVEKLTDKLATLKNYNGLEIPSSYFFESMERLRQRHLNISLDKVIHPLSDVMQSAVVKQQNAASQAKKVDGKELLAQQCFEQGNELYAEHIRKSNK